MYQLSSYNIYMLLGVLLVKLLLLYSRRLAYYCLSTIPTDYVEVGMYLIKLKVVLVLVCLPACCAAAAAAATDTTRAAAAVRHPTSEVCDGDVLV